MSQAQLLEEMKALALAEGPYANWRLTESAEKQGVNKRQAYESISPHQMTLGHAVNAIRGEQFDDARKILLSLREAVDKSLAALGANEALIGGR